MSQYEIIQPDDLSNGDRVRITFPSGSVMIGTYQRRLKVVKAIDEALKMKPANDSGPIALFSSLGKKCPVFISTLKESTIEFLGRAP